MILTYSLRRGYALLKTGNLREALDFFGKLAQKYPQKAEPLFEIGKIHYKLNQYSLARQYLLRATERPLTVSLTGGILEMTNWWMVSSSRFFNAHPAFSPDGKKIAYTSARADTNDDGRIDAKDRSALYLFDLASGREQEIASSEMNYSYPVWAPEGDSVAVLAAPADRPEAWGLYSIDLRTGESRMLLPPEYRPRYPVFHPKGPYLVLCTVDSPDGASGLSRVDLISGQVRSLTSHAWEHTYPQFTPDGQKVIFVSWRPKSPLGGRISLSENPGIFSLGWQSGQERELSGSAYSNAFPRVSPDGLSFLFLSRRRDTNGDGKIDGLDNFGLYQKTLGRLSESCLSTDTSYHKFPAWSYDAKTILYVGRWPHRASREVWQGDDYFEFKGIYAYSFKTGRSTVVMSDKFFGSRFCVPSPRSSLVAYISWRPNTNRGLFIADYSNAPSPEQLRGFIQNNLPE